MKAKFATAFMSPFAAISFLLGRPKLLGLAAAPVAINLAIVSLVVWIYSDYITYPAASGYGEFFGMVVKVFFTIFAVALGGLIAFLLAAPLAAPFNDLISERIEREVFRSTPELLAPSQTVWRSMRHALADSLLRLLVTIPFLGLIFALQFLFCIGPLIATALAFVYGVIFLALDAYSYSLDRRGIKLGGKFRYLRQNRDMALPTGSCLALMVAIPCSIIFLPTLGAVAGTRFFCAREQQRLALGAISPTSTLTEGGKSHSVGP
ncbi:hypothetical protein BH09SUM1_BH09SUM1_03980 [soil metagenome]